MNQAHSSKALLCMLTQTLERAAYYGTRALLLLYLIDEIGFARPDAFQLYAQMTLAFYLAKFFGGILGDLAIGNRLSIIIGQSIATAGILCFLIPDLAGIYLAITLFSVGAGMASPNLFAEIGREYSDKNKSIESGMTLLYTAINIGAFSGIFISALNSNYFISFGLMALISVLSLTAYLLIPQENEYDLVESSVKTKVDPKKNIQMTNLGIVGAIIIGFGAIIFWTCFEYLGFEINAAVMRVSESAGFDVGQGHNIFMTTNSITIVIAGILLSFLLLNKKFTPFMKVGLGLVFFAFSIICFGFLLRTELPAFIIIVTANALITLAEIIIAPTMLSIYIKKIPRNRLALASGIGAAALMIAMKAVGNMYSYSDEPTKFLVFAFPVLLVLVLLGIPYFFLDRPFAEAELEIDEEDGFEDEFN